jgi:demethylmenaquinone methyltransferase / 2-methoxy-6-polyprenyl-1,4-benzoquinol methylase
VISARKQHARTLFAGIARDYDRWAQILSLGQYRRWHDRLVERVAVDAGAVVADVATGTAAVAIALARRYGCRVIGVDQSPEMLEGGRRRVEAAGLAGRIELRQGEAERLPLEDGSVDAITFTYLLRYVDDPAATLRELARPLRPGAVMASLDFCVPRGAWLPAWRAWTRVGLPAGGMLAGDGWAETGRFLGPSIEAFWRAHPLDELLDMWSAAGMVDLHAQVLSLGGAVIVRGRRRP